MPKADRIGKLLVSLARTHLDMRVNGATPHRIPRTEARAQIKLGRLIQEARRLTGYDKWQPGDEVQIGPAKVQSIMQDGRWYQRGRGRR